MTGAEDESVDLSLASLNMDELMRLLVEAEEYAEHFAKNIADIRAELLERLDRDNPYDCVFRLDGPITMGHTVTAKRVRGPSGWKYNPKWVTNRLEELGFEGYSKKTLDTKTFNSALTNNEVFRKEFDEHVRWDRAPDRLQTPGLKELLKARGMQK